MLTRIGGRFRVDDYFVKNKNLTIITNVKPNFDILRRSGSLIVNGETRKMIKTAKLVTVAPKAGDFLYIRKGAVSAGNVIDHKDGNAELIPIDTLYKQFEKYGQICRGANDNGDFFSHEELLRSYKSFIGKAVFVDHDNENVEKARGIILDAVYNDKGKFVELLKAIDKKAYPELARAIEMSYVNSTSMGCRCGYSLCSICMNKSYTEEDFCDHIKQYKGSTYNGLPVWEDNRECLFIEDSVVSQPADPEAKVLEKIASKRADVCHHTRKNAVKDAASNILYMRLQNEQNQRSRIGQVRTMLDKLNDLPWH